MDFIDNIHPIAASKGRKFHILTQLANVINAGVGCSINFDDVDRMTFGDFFATGASLTGLTGGTVFTVQGLGQNSGYSGFPDSPHTRKHISMRNPFIVHGILKSLHDMRLPYDFIKGSRTIFSCGDLIFHNDGENCKRAVLCILNSSYFVGQNANDSVSRLLPLPNCLNRNKAY